MPLAGEAHGSIPAGAGEPIFLSSLSLTSRVYPRGCGGAYRRLAPAVLEEGLSPRVRGSLAAGAQGGAILAPHQGLSPRVRGSHS